MDQIPPDAGELAHELVSHAPGWFWAVLVAFAGLLSWVVKVMLSLTSHVRNVIRDTCFDKMSSDDRYMKKASCLEAHGMYSTQINAGDRAAEREAVRKSQELIHAAISDHLETGHPEITKEIAQIQTSLAVIGERQAVVVEQQEKHGEMLEDIRRAVMEKR